MKQLLTLVRFHETITLRSGENILNTFDSTLPNSGEEDDFVVDIDAQFFSIHTTQKAKHMVFVSRNKRNRKIVFFLASFMKLNRFL